VVTNHPCVSADVTNKRLYVLHKQESHEKLQKARTARMENTQGPTYSMARPIGATAWQKLQTHTL